MTHERDDDPVAARAAELLRAPVALDPELRARIAEAVRGAPPPRRRALGWLVERRLVLSPLVAGLIAAGLVGVGVLTARRDGRVTAAEQRDAALAPAAPAEVVRFVLVAPNATRVSLVGDFNDWNVAATPMRPANSGAIWTVALPLPAGRHVYAFVVDGREWIADPTAPLAPEDGFGTASSVVVVGEAAS